MSIFTLPEGFAENKTAILVPHECFEDFIEEIQNQGYKANQQMLLYWDNMRTKENRDIYFHFRERDSIQAFCRGSKYYDKLKLVHYDELFFETYEDILNLL